MIVMEFWSITFSADKKKIIRLQMTSNLKKSFITIGWYNYSICEIFTKVTISQIELKTFSRGFLRGFVSESTIVMKMISYLQILETKGKNSKIIHLKKINKLDQSYAVTKY